MSITLCLYSIYSNPNLVSSVCPQSYIRSFRDRQTDRRAYSHSRMMSRSRMGELDYDCGSQVPLTAPSGPPVRIWDGEMHTRTPSHTHNHTRLLQTSLSQLGIENLTLPCQPNRLPISPTGTQYVPKAMWVPHWFSPLRPVGGCIYLATLVLFCFLWVSRHKSRDFKPHLLLYWSGGHWKKWTCLVES